MEHVLDASTEGLHIQSHTVTKPFPAHNDLRGRGDRFLRILQPEDPKLLSLASEVTGIFGTTAPPHRAG